VAAGSRVDVPVGRAVSVGAKVRVSVGDVDAGAIQAVKGEAASKAEESQRRFVISYVAPRRATQSDDPAGHPISTFTWARSWFLLPIVNAEDWNVLQASGRYAVTEGYWWLLKHGPVFCGV
jgi:hypothetical protein